MTIRSSFFIFFSDVMWWSNGDWSGGLKVDKKNGLKYHCSLVVS